MREVREFRVSESELEATLVKFQKIVERGSSKGLEGGFKILGVQDVVEKSSEGIEYYWKVIQVECEPVKFSGWEFLSVAEVEQGVVLTRGIGSAEEVKPSQVRVGYCDHCQTSRSRKKYIFVKNESGEIKQVGSSCVKDFLGWEFVPSQLLQWSNLEEIGRGTSAPRWPSTVSVAAVALLATAKSGYKSAKSHGEQGSTKYEVLEILNPDSQYGKLLRRGYGITFPLTEQQLSKGQELVAFAQSFEGDSAYAENLRAVASLPYQTFSTIGVFVSSIIAKQKLEGQDQKTVKVYKSEQIAPVGERVEIQVTVLSKKAIETPFGISMLWVFESGDYKVKWFDSGYSFDAEVGEELTIKGTIKGADEYQGTFSTLVSRVKKVEKALIAK